MSNLVKPKSSFIFTIITAMPRGEIRFKINTKYRVGQEGLWIQLFFQNDY